MMRLLVPFFVVMIASGTTAFAATTTFDTTTPQGIDLTLEIDTPVTTAATSAIVCADTDSTVVEAKLWMVMDDGHQHGSTPTTLVSLGNRCYRVNGINFVMAGEWQIRVKLANSDRGTFFVPVAE